MAYFKDRETRQKEKLESGYISPPDQEFWQHGPNSELEPKAPKNVQKKKEKKEKKEKKAKEKSAWSFIKETVIIIVVALAIAIVLKSFIIDTRIIPTVSMYPTVEAGDRLIMSRLAYIGDKTPQRGDIIVFDAPAEFDSKDDFLKRVIGLPGEMVEIKDGQVFIDGVALEEDYISAPPNYIYGPVTVPEGHYFVLGDNRNQSQDSHAWSFPFVPEEDIKGKALALYWPLSRLGSLYD